MLLIKMSCALYTVARVCVLNDDILCTFMMVKIRIFILFVLFVLFVSFSTREKRDEFFSLKRKRRTRLTAEAVQGLALSLQRVDDIHGGDRLSSGVFGVRHRITNNVFQEHLQDTSGFFVD